MTPKTFRAERNRLRNVLRYNHRNVDLGAALDLFDCFAERVREVSEALPRGLVEHKEAVSLDQPMNGEML
jgi:hypothetical protein